jgi:glutaredoxin 3
MMAPARFKSYGAPRGRSLKGRMVAAAKVEIYTKIFCGYCHRAKRLLASKGVDFVEYDITMDNVKRDEMRARAPGARTVPQIFIDGAAVGGSDDLAALEREGKLDALLGL